MSNRALRQEMARDLRYVGVEGDLDAIADFLVSRRGWTNEEANMPSLVQTTIQHDPAGTVRIGITGFAQDGAPMLGNIARTAAERVSEARHMLAARRGEVQR